MTTDKTTDYRAEARHQTTERVDCFECGEPVVPGDDCAGCGTWNPAPEDLAGDVRIAEVEATIARQS